MAARDRPRAASLSLRRRSKDAPTTSPSRLWYALAAMGHARPLAFSTQLAARVAMAAAVLGLLAFALSGCAAGDRASPEADLRVDLREWSVTASRAELPAGRAKILVKNAGSLAHDFVVIRTDLAPDRLPVEGGVAREDGKVAKTAVINPGASTTVTVELAAGKYLLICNQPGHYASGMRSQLSAR